MPPTQKRPNPGRPPIPIEDRRIQASVTLRAETITALRAIGGGNLSRGIEMMMAGKKVLDKTLRS